MGILIDILEASGEEVRRQGSPVISEATSVVPKIRVEDKTLDQAIQQTLMPRGKATPVVPNSPEASIAPAPTSVVQTSASQEVVQPAPTTSPSAHAKPSPAAVYAVMRAIESREVRPSPTPSAPLAAQAPDVPPALLQKQTNLPAHLDGRSAEKKKADAEAMTRSESVARDFWERSPDIRREFHSVEQFSAYLAQFAGSNRGR